MAHSPPIPYAACSRRAERYSDGGSEREAVHVRTGKVYSDEVKVEEKEGDKATVIELSVAAEDMGKVIGKQGRIAQAIRCVVKAASVKENKKYIVEIV